MFVEWSFMDLAKASRTSVVLVSLLSSTLGGCATSGSTSLMDARAEAPLPPKANAYLPVEDLPPAREKAALTLAEQTKIKKELISSRDQQAAIAKAKNAAPIESVKP